MPKLYIDTNIIIDAINGRHNKFGKNIGNPASDLFFDAFSCKHHLIISTLTLEELNWRGVSNTRLFFEFVKNKTINSHYIHEERDESKKRSKEHANDALHIILAEKEKADCIVTRNINHFKEIGTHIPIKIPEKLL